MDKRKDDEEPDKKKPEKSKEKDKTDFLDGKKEEEWCDWIDTQIRKHPVVLHHHGKWKELMAWEEGQQYDVWDSKTNKLSPVNLNIRKIRCVVNLFKPALEALEGKVSFSSSIIGVPNSGEQKDIAGSKIATKFLAFNDYVNDSDGIMEEVKEDMFRTGQGCEKWIFDKDSSGMARGKNENGEDTVIEEPGEVIGQCVPIFNIRPDPSATTIDGCKWFIEIKEVSGDELKEKFPDIITDKVLEEMNGANAQKYEGLYKKYEDVQEEIDTFIFAEYWERPSEKFKNGRLIQSCGSKVLFKGANPAPKRKKKNGAGDLPYFMYYYKKRKYSFWSKGPLHYVQDTQRYVNRLVSMAMEHIEAWKPKLIIGGKTVLRRMNSLTTDSMEIVAVDNTAGGEPRPMAMPTLSGEVGAMRDFWIGNYHNVFNIREVGYSRLPQYATRAPASLYAMMLEQENQKLGGMVKFVNSTLLKRASYRLMLMEKHYELPRYAKIVGRGKEVIANFMRGIDINSNYDVQLEMGVSLNQSTTIQTQLFIQLFEKGLIGKQDGRKVLRVLNLGTAEHELRSDIIDDEKAVRENQAFIDGTYNRSRQEGGVSFSIHDDHELHLERHTNLEKSEETNAWDEQRLADLQNHELEHYTALQQVKMSQQISTETMKGAPAPETSVGSPGEAAPEGEVGGGGGEMAEPGAGEGAGGGEMVAPGEATAVL